MLFEMTAHNNKGQASSPVCSCALDYWWVCSVPNQKKRARCSRQPRTVVLGEAGLVLQDIREARVLLPCGGGLVGHAVEEDEGHPAGLERERC
jgi:hypothetical protein